MKTPGALGTHVAFGLAFAVMAVLFTDWCAVVFECGCRSIWNGAAEFCNIHAAAPPHCPWCAHPLLGGATAFFAALGGQWLAVYRVRAAAVVRLALALAAFPLLSGLAAWVQSWVWGYGP